MTPVGWLATAYLASIGVSMLIGRLLKRRRLELEERDRALAVLRPRAHPSIPGLIPRQASPVDTYGPYLKALGTCGTTIPCRRHGDWCQDIACCPTCITHPAKEIR